jgi:hypothetical protein
MQCAIVDGSRTMALIHVKQHLDLPVSGLCCAFLALVLDLPEPVGGALSTARSSGLPISGDPAHPLGMGDPFHGDTFY